MHVITKEFIVQEYIDGKKSFVQMEQETGISASRFRYFAQKFNVPLRDRVEAQKLSREQGRSYNPCEGKSLSDEHREAISRSRAAYFQNLSDDERQKLSKQNKRNGKNIQKFKEAGHSALKTVARKGSLIEHYLVEKLTLLGYHPFHHKNYMIQNENMHIDIMLEQERIAIEIDGPQHMRALYSEEEYKKKKEKDARKNGLLMQEGYVVIRYGIERSRTLITKQNALKDLLEAIEKFKGGEPQVVYMGKYTTN